MAILVAGLGNPGADYAGTRHNAGWMVLDLLAERLGISFGEPPAALKGQWACAEAGGKGCEIVLLRPLTYMNLSGDAVAPALGHLGLEPTALVTVTDEMQLPLGKLKLTSGGSDGGHNGLKSVAYRLGTKEFRRLRIGVGPAPGEGLLSRDEARAMVEAEFSADGASAPQADGAATQTGDGTMRDYVLGAFEAREAPLLGEVLAVAADAVMQWARGDGTEGAWLRAQAAANSRSAQPLQQRLREIEDMRRQARERARAARAEDSSEAGMAGTTPPPPERPEPDGSAH